MQKGKRYKETNAGGNIWEFDEQRGTTLHFIRLSGSVSWAMSDLTFAHALAVGLLVELPDDDFHNDALSRRYYGMDKNPSAHCDHNYVNYTPYHDASPRAKFACAKCDKEK